MIKRIKNEPKDIILLSIFLKNAGASLEKFRYFNDRHLGVIDDHIYTILILDQNNSPVAYGHLDPEKEVVWLGICVSENVRRKGYGKQIMVDLINKATEIGLAEICLKVDSNNIKAISLYRNFMFEIISEKKDEYFIMKYIVINDKF